MNHPVFPVPATPAEAVRLLDAPLEALLDSEGREKLGLRFAFHVGSETTLPGSAAAALLNC